MLRHSLLSRSLPSSTNVSFVPHDVNPDRHPFLTVLLAVYCCHTLKGPLRLSADWFRVSLLPTTMDYIQGLTEPPVAEEYKLPPEELDTEFKKAFPPDPLGHEMDDGARVWRVYRAEAMSHDTTLLEGWSGTLDILLIFAGLFSAVATAFESFQLLQPNNAAYTATALWILVAASNHTTGVTLPPPPDLSYASPLTRWINGLWFTSILLSLTVALLSILVKQWISEYRSRNNASAKSPRDWARRREVYFQALAAWPVAEVVSFLPVMLHLSLFLFFAGMALLLWTLDKSIGVWVVALGVCLSVFYLGCTLVPLWIPESPTATPLIHHIRRVVLWLATKLLRLCARARALPLLLRTQRAFRPRRWTTKSRNPLCHDLTAAGLVSPIVSQVEEVEDKSPDISTRLAAAVDHIETQSRDKSAISARLSQNCDYLDAAALYWLINDVSDSDAVAVGIQALGAVHPTSPLAERLRANKRLIHMAEDNAFTRSATQRSVRDVARFARSVLCMRREEHTGIAPLVHRMQSLRALRGGRIDAEYPDTALLYSNRRYIVQNAGRWRIASPSLSSTIMLALRAEDLSPPFQLAYLSCCDFSRCSEADWDLILNLFLTRGRTSYDAAGLAVPPSRLYGPLRLGDIISQLALRSSSDEVKTLAGDLVFRLISALPDTASSMPPLPSQSRSLRYQPFLLDFLVSPTALGQGHETPCLRGISRWLSWCQDDAMQTHHLAYKFWTLCSFLAHAAQSIEVVHDIHLWLSSTCITALRACFASRTKLLTALDFILSPSPARRDRQPLWRVLASALELHMWNSGSELSALWLDAWTRLATVVATALCIAVKRDGETDFLTACIDAYFATLDLKQVWRLWERAAVETLPSYGIRRDVIIHMLRHCLELRPQWWTVAVDHVQMVGRDSERTIALELDTEIPNQGPCTLCSNWFI
ncbi:hypothetical protein EXIGLDRAFT_146750 [Exidia glandulosa HHB12029]|uniref:DUF6535 domain-containing protein n=1 Tax=Exidia glandulosa HHB12029 TaxID=1314781 RepID=A0A165FSV8_EXIGL|nr:hypothetical protein EXIGLDRAFT_146750 [Exidia glandulosa HHB12029]